MTAIHTHVSTEYLPTWSILTVAGRVTGPEVSASQWLSCARAILHCWRPTCTASDAETPPLVHIAMVLMRRQNIWCYTAQHTTRCGGSHGQISTIKATQGAYRALWRGSGWWPVPPTGNGRERESCSGRHKKLSLLLLWIVSSWSLSSRSLQRRDCDADRWEQTGRRWLLDVDVSLPAHDSEPKLLQPARSVTLFALFAHSVMPL